MQYYKNDERRVGSDENSIIHDHLYPEFYEEDDCRLMYKAIDTSSKNTYVIRKKISNWFPIRPLGTRCH